MPFSSTRGLLKFVFARQRTRFSSQSLLCSDVIFPSSSTFSLSLLKFTNVNMNNQCNFSNIAIMYSTWMKDVEHMLQSWTKVLGTAWKYDTCSLTALFSTLWRVAFAQSDVPPPPGQCCSEKVHFQPTDTTLRGGGGSGKSKRGDFQRKSAGVPTLLSRIVWVERPKQKCR